MEEQGSESISSVMTDKIDIKSLVPSNSHRDEGEGLRMWGKFCNFVAGLRG